ncbi:hypothetical protein HIM_08501 [Hirsutella minnesotensis 3608]|uniref:Uncharacterized protein n=1 Tax=Hirsutella minnesotensis 3608 TaxID=1043627 RepID=A0A0F7ZSX6_9HYPO|nr:hypothetical protein HIM_08501 [Hirsutella minnesotensis 3608]
MPVKTRSRGAGRAGQLQRLATQFGELETTPTNRHHRAEIPSASNTYDAALNPALNTEEKQSCRQSSVLGDGFADFDFDFKELDSLSDLDPDKRSHNHFPWSETDSLAKRSSPHAGETPTAKWEFEGNESLPPLSTPQSGKDQLPDTVPLTVDAATAPQPIEVSLAKKIDFSETASTARRSSPFDLGDHVKDVFSFDDDFRPSSLPPPPAREASRRSKSAAESPSDHHNEHLPMDDIYDATPPPPTGRPMHIASDPRPIAGRTEQPVSTEPVESPPDEAAVQLGRGQPTLENVPAGDAPLSSANGAPKASIVHGATGKRARRKHEGSLENNAGKRQKNTTSKAGDRAPAQKTAQETTNVGAKSSRRKQRRKSPLQFEEVNQQLVARPADAATKTIRKARMPIVSALRDSVQPSSPHLVVPKNRAVGKIAQPRKKAKRVEGKPHPLAATKSTAKQPSQASRPIRQQNQAARRPQAKVNETGNQSKPSSPDGTNPEPITVSIGEGSDSITSSASDWMPSQGLEDQPADSTSPPTHSKKPLALVESVPRRPPTATTNIATSSSEVLQDSEVPAPKSIALAETVKSRMPLSARPSNVLRDSKENPEQITHLPSSIAANSTDSDLQDPERRRKPEPRRLSRNFSISVKGSPLPAHSQQTPPQTRNQAKGHGRNFANEPVSLDTTNEGPFLARVQRLKHQSHGSNHKTASQKPRVRASDRARESAEDGASTRQEERLHKVDCVRADVHSKILSSLRDAGNGLTERLQNDQTADDSGSCAQGQRRNPSSNGNGIPSDGLSLRMQDLISAMIKQLRTMEGAGHKVAKMYRTKTAECVERIGKRQGQEHSLLAETLRRDAEGFGDVVQDASRAVAHDSRLRETGLQDLRHDTLKRLSMYDATIKNLRAMNRQILGSTGLVRTDA